MYTRFMTSIKEMKLAGDNGSGGVSGDVSNDVSNDVSDDLSEIQEEYQ